MGISKIQAADVVVAFIPNSQNRQVGALRAKILKTRDSGGVGSYLNFRTDWPTLTFEPMGDDFNANTGATLGGQKTEVQKATQPIGKPILNKNPTVSEIAKVEKSNDESGDGDSSTETPTEKKSAIGGIVGGIATRKAFKSGRSGKFL